MIKMHFKGRLKKYHIWLMIFAGAISVVGTVIIMRHHVAPKNAFSAAEYKSSENLYKDWDTFPGAGQSEHNGVHFSAIDRKIVNQDGSGGQDNPAVNVGGPHLAIGKGFGFEIGMSDLDKGDATFRLYAELPTIYDEWRYEGASFSVTISGRNIITRQWNGNSEAPMSTLTYKDAAPGSSAVLVFSRQKDNIVVQVNGKNVVSESAAGLLGTGRIWLGASSTGDGWTLNSLRVGNGTVLESPLDSKAQSNADSLGILAAKARPGLLIGTAVNLYPLMSDQSYRNLALSQFTQWTPENEMKAQFIHPAKDTFDFRNSDLLVDTALKNSISVHGHALVFGEANPLWMQQTPKSELKSVMISHITTIMAHYKGKVAEWDVVNEPLDDYEGNPDGLRRSIWYGAMGKGFIAEALRAAHEADPAAKLYINEFGLEEDGERWTTFINLVKELKVAGVPLDGVGFQAHVYEAGDEIDPSILIDHIRLLAGLGISSRISEIDVHGEEPDLQTRQYQAVAGACLAEPSCTAFASWGISDKYGSTTSIRSYPPEYGDDLLWDSNFQSKNALQSLIKVLR